MFAAIVLLGGFATSAFGSASSIFLTVYTDKSSYSFGENVVVSGQLTDHDGNPIDEPLTLEVSANGSRVRVDQFTVTPSGSYEYTFPAGSLFESGSHEVIVSYKGEWDSAFFDYDSTGSGSEEPDRIGRVDFSKDVFNVGDTVQVNGDVSGNLDNYMTIRAVNPSGAIYRVDQILADSDGSFEYSFVLDGAQAIEGEWTLMIDFGDTGSDRSFQVGGADVTLPIEIDWLRVEDISHNPITQPIAVNDQVVFTFDGIYTGSEIQGYVVLLQISLANGGTSYITWQTGNVHPDDKLAPGFSFQPLIAGSYTVQAFIWSSLDNPTPLSEPASIDLDVIA